VDGNNQQVGIVEVQDALQQARDAGMDLVEVAPQASPPVCRIMDFGKWQYQQRKKEQRSKAHSHETELKQIRIRTPKIGEHDLQLKVNHAREFLDRGDRVQFTLRFRGRELAHIDEGQKVFENIIASLADVSKIDQRYRREGRRITMTLAPDSSKKQAAAARAKATRQQESEGASSTDGAAPAQGAP